MHNSYEIYHELTGVKPKFNESPVFTTDDILLSCNIEILIDNLQIAKKYWQLNTNYIDGCLLQFFYKTIVSKSKRLDFLLRDTNFYKNIVGTRYDTKDDFISLVATYLSLNISDIDLLINRFKNIKNYIDTKFGGVINSTNFSSISENPLLGNLNKKNSIKLLLEISRIRKISYPNENIQIKDSLMVHFFVNPKKLVQDLGLEVLVSSISNNTLILKKKDIELVLKKAPYLVSSANDTYFNMPKKEKCIIANINPETLPEPKDEFYVGVIDGPFNSDCYLNKWVDYEDCRGKEKEFGRNLDAEFHGTQVSSLIVHGNKINESLGLEDNCGYFRVKHFAVMNDDGNNILILIDKIRDIVEKNYKKIKVWNLSLGTFSEISDNYISPVAALLDELQSQYDIIFVVAATNRPKNKQFDDELKIGSPADSINSLVVGSNTFEPIVPASYSRKGGVLNFFIKPDVSYYGGDQNKEIISFNGEKFVYCSGTSFSTPLVTRKVAFLIYKMKFSREIAKALIIDNASKWNLNFKNQDRIGRGVVDVDINKVISCDDDEIKFVYRCQLKDYISDNYSLPIPLNDDNKFPFAVKATFCYFSKCSMLCGVDYTNEEIDFNFGYYNDGFKSISGNLQYETDGFINEKKARRTFSKWDNVKQICEKTENRRKSGKEVGGAQKWGFKLITVYRNEDILPKQKYKEFFGVIVTLKSLDGENRDDEFRKNVESSNWLIKPINVQEEINLSVKLNQDVKFTNS